MPPAAYESLVRRMDGEPETFVAQERVALSTVPVRTDTGIVPRHAVLRVYAGVACRAGVSGGTQCGPMRFLLSQNERPAGVQAIIRHTVHSSGRGVSACKEKASCLQGDRIILKILPPL